LEIPHLLNLRISFLIYGLLITASSLLIKINIPIPILQSIKNLFFAYYLFVFALLLFFAIYYNPKIFYQLYNIKNLYLKIKNSSYKFSLKRLIILILIIAYFRFYNEPEIKKLFEFLSKNLHYSFNYDEIKIIVKELIKTSPWWFIVIQAPIIEEIIFRFFLFYSLKNFFGKYIGIILTTIFFALAHSYSPAYIILIIPSSFVFVYLTHIYDSLIPSTILHIIGNAIAYFMFK